MCPRSCATAASAWLVMRWAAANSARQLLLRTGWGAALARVEMQEALARTLARFPGLHHDGDLDAVELHSNLFTYYPRELRVLP